ncbi:MAG: methylated-DNA--[protein]-cysteine S-methyltransferase, partial [Candidatus Rifleibacteriota bacterium]
ALQTQPTEPVNFAIQQIKNYFAKTNFDFSKISLDLSSCNNFAKKIYKTLQKTEPGDTVSYKTLALSIDKPGASRAVGKATGANPIPLIIPCHRVIKSDGKIGGFSSSEGISQKIEMLEIEGVRLNSKKNLVLPPETLSEQNIATGIEFICKQDSKLNKFVKQLPEFKLNVDTISSPFQSLLEAIVYQQLTGKAAETIYKKLLDLFCSNGKVQPLDIIRAPDNELREVGLSQNKILAAKDLAEKTFEGIVPNLHQLERMSDFDIISSLAKIRGIGRWTVEMLLLFKLGRPDILAIDDYGLRKGYAILKNKENLPSPVELKKEGRAFRPWRTILSWYLWRIAETG